MSSLCITRAWVVRIHWTAHDVLFSHLNVYMYIYIYINSLLSTVIVIITIVPRQAEDSADARCACMDPMEVHGAVQDRPFLRPGGYGMERGCMQG